MAKLIAAKPSLIFILVGVVFSCAPSGTGKTLMKRNAQPCKRIVLHMHDIRHQPAGLIANNSGATSATLTKSVPGLDKFSFGELNVYDNPMTSDTDMNSSPAARARGFYLYDSKDTYNTLFMITLNFNSTEFQGTLTMLGTNTHTLKSRDIPIIGGTGDFFLARGINSIETEAIDLAKSYFRLKMDIKLYECYY